MPKDIHITRRIRGETDTYKVPGTISMRDVKRKRDDDDDKAKKPKKPQKKRRNIVEEESEDSDGNPIY